jgi:putative transposase
MGTIDAGCDNSMIESFLGTMQVMLLNRKKWRTRLELANAIFGYIEVYYKRSRLHSALTWESPVASKAQEPNQKILA